MNSNAQNTIVNYNNDKISLDITPKKEGITTLPNDYNNNNTPYVKSIDIKEKKKTKRCNFSECNKKLKLTDVQCKCKQIFCYKHRYSESHNCTYDYKTAGREQLTKNNPQIICSKLEAI